MSPRALAVRVTGPGRQSFDHGLRRRAEQDDQVETDMETDLVLLAPGDEPDIGVLGVQHCGDGHRCHPSDIGSHQPSSVSMALYPSAVSSPITLDFPVPDNAGQQNPLHGGQPTILPPPAAPRRARPDPGRRSPYVVRCRAVHAIGRIFAFDGACRLGGRPRALARTAAQRVDNIRVLARCSAIRAMTCAIGAASTYVA